MTAFNIPSYLEELSATIDKLPLLAIDSLVQVLLQAYDGNRTVFLFGNGGSAALASHMSCDLGKGIAPATGKRLRAIALTDNVALITAWANDTKYESIFSEQLENLLQPGDLAFAITASGNSPNMLAALNFARQARATTIGLTGFQGGKLKALCDLCVVIPSDDMQIIEDLQLSICHSVFRALRHEIQAANRPGAGIALTQTVPNRLSTSFSG
jgi:D-sedoheptulose 7-phosphate isomerase